MYMYMCMCVSVPCVWELVETESNGAFGPGNWTLALKHWAIFLAPIFKNLSLTMCMCVVFTCWHIEFAGILFMFLYFWSWKVLVLSFFSLLWFCGPEQHWEMFSLLLCFTRCFYPINVHFYDWFFQISLVNLFFLTCSVHFIRF